MKTDLRILRTSLDYRGMFVQPSERALILVAWLHLWEDFSSLLCRL